MRQTSPVPLEMAPPGPFKILPHVLLMDVHFKSCYFSSAVSYALFTALPSFSNEFLPFGHLGQKIIPLRAGKLECSQDGITLAHAWQIT